MTTANISDDIVKAVTMSGLDYHLTQTPCSIQFSIRKKFIKRFNEASESKHNSFEVEKLLEETEVLKENLYQVQKEYQFPLVPMGVLVPGSAHTRPSAQPPIDTSGNFPPHMSVESPSKISPNP